MTWKRLEGSAVSSDLTEGLEARIADPLWLLARQWQVGEFAGEDAASPVEVKAKVAFHPIGEVRLGGATEASFHSNSQPLEARVESESIWQGPARIRVAAEAGLHLLRLAEAAGAGSDLRARLREAWPLTLPEDDGLDPRGRLELELLAARSFDGAALLDALQSGATPDPDFAAVATAWIDSQLTLFTEPEGHVAKAWDATRMEYRFEVAAPSFAAGTRLESKEYPGGRLDWRAFDVPSDAAPELATGAKQRTIKTVPIPLRYPGMPAPRWWAFEDGAVYWGDIQAGPEDLARYLIASFATIYGDDWYLVPIDLPRGVLAQATSVGVMDAFGAKTSVLSTAALDFDEHGDDRSWRFFELSGDGAPASGLAPRLLLPATLPPHSESQPLEEVLLLRDEVANLAWGVERSVESPAGRPASRVRETSADEGPTPASGAWGYDLATAVPPYFVPLVPVRTESTSAIRFQRGRMATTGSSTGARGLILEPSRRLLIREEEVPASGVRLTRAFQMCRASDGSVHVWVGRRKSPGRDPRSSGLEFDVLTITDGG